MTSVTVIIKAKNVKEAVALINSVSSIVSSGDCDKDFEHSVELVHREGEASVVVIQDQECYHGVKINCCE
jgi:hypothetical protein